MYSRIFLFTLNFNLKLNEKSINNLKQLDPFDWITINYPWPKNSHFLIPINQRLLRLKYYEDFLTNSARSSTSSEDNNLQTTLIERDQNKSNNQQQLVS